MKKNLVWISRIVLVCIVMLFAACNVPVAPGANLNEGEDIEESGGEGTVPTEVEPVEPEEEDSAPVEAEPEGEAGNYAPCPVKEGALILKFSAVLKMKVEEMSLTHVLDDGILNLGLVESDGPVYQVYTIEPTTIRYTMTGTVGDCSIQGEGTMRPEASGTCQDGVLRLTIMEDWSQVDGSVTCDGETSPIPPIPGLGKMVHTGADGKGEIFPLDAGFSAAGPGYTSIRPFQMGEGEHIWTVFVDPYLVKP